MHKTYDTFNGRGAEHIHPPSAPARLLGVAGARLVALRGVLGQFRIFRELIAAEALEAELDPKVFVSFL